MTLVSGTRFFAHTLPNAGQEAWEPLEVHLNLVASLARSFGERFSAGDMAYLAGLWHDLGKYAAEFQGYLGVREFLSYARARVDHSTAGAQHAVKSLPDPIGRMIAYCIAGHHAGLPDTQTESDSSLEVRLAKRIPSYSAATAAILNHHRPTLPSLSFDELPTGRALQASMLCRFLFSCLVDADYLATEQFLDHNRSELRSAEQPSMTQLEAAASAYVEGLMSKAESTLVNEQRLAVLQACKAAAELSPGLFSLTVPTGGGKSLSSLLFALKHARLHGLDRVIYSIPFTSIIEQNARVFRTALADCGESVVLEHHSNFDSGERDNDEKRWSDLASENWDAPVVVTTNVQFFESLFASRTSRCRKLHRIVGSVIILDEAQTIPVEVLKPCLAALQELARNYNCSIVLCSATQPAVHWNVQFPIGLRDVREIVPDTIRLFDTLRRVDVTPLGSLSDAELVDRLLQHDQTLVVVNTKRHAVRLYELLRRHKTCIHLSAFMCPEHRSECIATIRSRLKAQKPCVVISTQLIEAGVDLDFPTVYRSLAGLDSIAQAAGRCNREGRSSRGHVYVFEPEGGIPPGFLRQTAQTAHELIGRYDDLLSLDAIRHYFDLHYWKRRNEWDKHEVMACFRDSGRVMNFRTAAKRFRMIPDETESIIVPWGDKGEEAVRRLRKAEPQGFRAAARAVQRFSVQVRRFDWVKLQNGALEPVHDRFWVLARKSLYDEEVGLIVDAGEVWQPEELVV